MKTDSLNKPSLQKLASEQDVSEVDQDADTSQTKAEMIEALKAKGVEDVPEDFVALDGDGNPKDAESRAASDRDISGNIAGGTPGGASESQQPSAGKQGLPGTGSAVLPDLDPETTLGVTPRPAMPRNPALEYDDSARG